MNISELLRSLGDRLGASASVKNVYGDPITAGERTVVPVAQISYAFGGGAGGAHGDREPANGGGGGRVSAKPCGALEITPAGTRFIHFTPRNLAMGAVIGFAAGAMITRRRISAVKR